MLLELKNVFLTIKYEEFKFLNNVLNAKIEHS